MQNKNDEYFMHAALRQARKALQNNEVPVGAVIVHNGRIIARGWNEREKKQDPCRHAEIAAIQRAARALGNWRLLDCALYVTLEPCAMCAGAIVLARIPRVIYAAADPKAGACGSVFNILAEKKLNHHPAVISGVLADEAGQMLKDFFRAARKNEVERISLPPRAVASHLTSRPLRSLSSSQNSLTAKYSLSKSSSTQ